MILAGKGHETYQVLKDRVIHFDDREVARDVLQELGYKAMEFEVDRRGARARAQR